jgi:hypothetical protein
LRTVEPVRFVLAVVTDDFARPVLALDADAASTVRATGDTTERLSTAAPRPENDRNRNRNIVTSRKRLREWVSAF